MRSRNLLIAAFVLIDLTLIAVYLWPVPGAAFDQLYAAVEPTVSARLQAFRQGHPLQTLDVNGKTWEYLAAGRGADTIVFLHGMTGAADIWWQQIAALEGDYRIIALTYPAEASLAGLEDGLLAVLAAEGVDSFNLVGTSLGGYFAQYLVGRHPERIEKVVFSNTFPPNELILEKNGTIGALLPFLPEWLVISVLRGSFADSIYPTAGNDELTLAFLNEIAAGRMRKAQVVARYQCVVEEFTAPQPTLPVLIIESDNDPLVELALREQLKTQYPEAQVYTFSAAGHFPYLNRSQEYSRILAAFFAE